MRPSRGLPCGSKSTALGGKCLETAKRSQQRLLFQFQLERHSSGAPELSSAPAFRDRLISLQFDPLSSLPDFATPGPLTHTPPQGFRVARSVLCLRWRKCLGLHRRRHTSLRARGFSTLASQRFLASYLLQSLVQLRSTIPAFCWSDNY